MIVPILLLQLRGLSINSNACPSAGAMPRDVPETDNRLKLKKCTFLTNSMEYLATTLAGKVCSQLNDL
ncbi:hypothetical protein PHMEG_00019087 [Phytophthora megakarya]|uniref:Uncharacterized protein n=1 Tax=Phytophthora megakarya TaxID=4795 RepID=A0A225VT92_9STRA|nr:hypothetical protein PHMEG_00019087 [Phytophthora megakarya]